MAGGSSIYNKDGTRRPDRARDLLFEDHSYYAPKKHGNLHPTKFSLESKDILCLEYTTDNFFNPPGQPWPKIAEMVDLSNPTNPAQEQLFAGLRANKVRIQELIQNFCSQDNLQIFQKLAAPSQASPEERSPVGNQPSATQATRSGPQQGKEGQEIEV